MLSDLIAHGPVVRLIEPPKWRVDLHCMAIGSGYERRENETYDWEGSKRGAFALIQHTIGGRGELDYAGARHALLPGDTMVLTFPSASRYWLAAGRSWEYFWLGINGIEALRIVRAVIDSGGPVLRLAPQTIDQLADACLELTAHEPTTGRASAASYGALMALYEGAFERDDLAVPQASAPIRRAIGQIERDLPGNLDVDRLAAAAQLSRAHFVRRFTQEVGVSPSAYVFATRIRLVERLLVATDATIASIAAAAGFADGNYLAKAFRRTTGMAPGQYRLQQRPGGVRQG